MLDDPHIPSDTLRAALSDGFGLASRDWRFVTGYDLKAATYDVDGAWFAKVRFGPFATAPLQVPAALHEAGVVNVLPPRPTVEGALWQPMSGDRSLIVYPYVDGASAMAVGMHRHQWIAFGAALRAVHETPVAVDLPADAFELPAAEGVRGALGERADERLTAVLEMHRDRIGRALERASVLGEHLRRRTFERVLCHADIHGANVLVAEDGRIFLVDWDGPMDAPRERDLLFVIGSRIARRVTPEEEGWFFSGYGAVEVDPEAIVFYRYERILEDIAEFARSVREDEQSDASRREQVATLESFFEPGGILEAAEAVTTPWSRDSGRGP